MWIALVVAASFDTVTNALPQLLMLLTLFDLYRDICEEFWINIDSLEFILIPQHFYFCYNCYDKKYINKWMKST